MAAITDVAIVAARCRRTRAPFVVRVEADGAQVWRATYAERAPGDGSAKHAGRKIPAFGFASGYPGCPDCRDTTLFLCGCGALACWDGRVKHVVCPVCDRSLVLNASVDTLDAGRG